MLFGFFYLKDLIEVQHLSTVPDLWSNVVKTVPGMKCSLGEIVDHDEVKLAFFFIFGGWVVGDSRDLSPALKDHSHKFVFGAFIF